MNGLKIYDLKRAQFQFLNNFVPRAYIPRKFISSMVHVIENSILDDFATLWKNSSTTTNLHSFFPQEFRYSKIHFLDGSIRRVNEQTSTDIPHGFNYAFKMMIKLIFI